MFCSWPELHHAVCILFTLSLNDSGEKQAIRHQWMINQVLSVLYPWLLYFIWNIHINMSSLTSRNNSFFTKGVKSPPICSTLLISLMVLALFVLYVLLLLGRLGSLPVTERLFMAVPACPQKRSFTVTPSFFSWYTLHHLSFWASDNAPSISSNDLGNSSTGIFPGMANYFKGIKLKPDRERQTRPSPSKTKAKCLSYIHFSHAHSISILIMISRIKSLGFDFKDVLKTELTL